MALILAAPVDEKLLEKIPPRLYRGLEGFGFAPCPGNVMVRNAVWSQPLADYLSAFRRWVALPDENAHMNVAIFYDAVAVAGNARLLGRPRPN